MDALYILSCLFICFVTIWVLSLFFFSVSKFCANCAKKKAVKDDPKVFFI